MQAFSEAMTPDASQRLRIHTVQTLGAYPLQRAHHRVALLWTPDDPDYLDRALQRRRPAVHLHVAVGERAEEHRHRDPRR